MGDTVVCPMADFESFLNSTSDVFPYQVSDDADTQKLAFSSQWQLFLESEFAADSLAEALSYVDEDGEIKLYAIKFDTTLTSAVFDVDDFSDYRAKVDDFIADASEACPDTLCDSTFQTEFLCCWSRLSTPSSRMQCKASPLPCLWPSWFYCVRRTTGSSAYLRCWTLWACWSPSSASCSPRAMSSGFWRALRRW